MRCGRPRATRAEVTPTAGGAMEWCGRDLNSPKASINPVSSASGQRARAVSDGLARWSEVAVTEEVALKALEPDHAEHQQERHQHEDP
jgi:hypothetical protein